MKPKTAAIVQARMGSSRLPGKVLMHLGGRTVLDHVLSRCLAIDGVDIVICATTTAARDDAVAAEAQRIGCSVFRGSESDVLDRYCEAARAAGVNTVLRVTSDCPLIDPVVCADVLKLRSERHADFADNNATRTFPHGLDCEAFTFELLEEAANKAVEPDEREHVSPWMRRQSGVSRVTLAKPGPSLAHHRWTLDTPDDFAFLTSLFERLPAGREAYGWQSALAVTLQTSGHGQ